MKGITKSNMYIFYSPEGGEVEVEICNPGDQITVFAKYYMDCKEQALLLDKKDLPKMIDIFQDILKEETKEEDKSGYLNIP